VNVINFFKKIGWIALQSIMLAGLVRSSAAEPQGVTYPLSTTVPQMIGATRVAPGQSPWQVALVRSNGTPVQTVFCGGTLIDSEWVLTAAHCFYDRKTCKKIARQTIYIAYGSEDLGVEYSIMASEKLIHPDGYSCGNKQFDIGLIKLAKPVKVTKFVELASAATATSMVKPGNKFLGAGWGLTKVDGMKTRFLMEAEIPILNEDQCRTAYGKIWPKGAICAGGTGKDACTGDSGGPLYQRTNSTGDAIQVGVISFGDGCGEVKTPGAYTAVAEQLSWIEQARRPEACTSKVMAESRC
jgi:secreted trypsin-like serine protease